uniref:Uncharacterized protein n=1 Tax=Timema shepardi TaxID=629360 RepID=A0A7R9G599_TIMSH|nr:unnamed protein product [Timema shepardi]
MYRVWWSKTANDYFERLIQIFKSVIMFLLKQTKHPNQETSPRHTSAPSVLIDMSTVQSQDKHSIAICPPLTYAIYPPLTYAIYPPLTYAIYPPLTYAICPPLTYAICPPLTLVSSLHCLQGQ